ncbi:MAG: glycoside hydrolase family 78 protein [Tannerella sp.]|jgi:alpha-L-rhamnosidase|nr:glycoside hydrolase family 78 protein [Tannerella sp.]
MKTVQYLKSLAAAGACLLWGVLASGCHCPAAVKNLRVEYMSNPVGIDAVNPRFSWEMESRVTGKRQTAYELILWDEDRKTTVYTSGKTPSDQSLGIQCAGLALAPATRYYWTVSVWDNDGRKIAASEKAFFETGLPGSGWHGAQWIKIADRDATDAIPIFRTTFTATKTVRSARIYASALGVYDLFINGKRVGTTQPDGSTVYDELKPGWTDYRKTAMYSTYDVTNLLQKGKNAIGAQVASGWFTGAIARGEYGNPPLGFIARLYIRYADGTDETLLTSPATWKASTHPALRTADIYHGETYDARNETDWTAAAFDDSDWKPADVNDYFHGELIAFIGPPVRVRPHLEQSPKTVTVYDGIKPTGTTFGEINIVRTLADGESLTLRKGETAIYDFGQNMVGWIKFKVKGARGTKINARFAEMLNDSGERTRGNDNAKGSLYLENLRDAKASLSYTLKGDDRGETFHPSTTFFGFRYAGITASDDLVIETVKGEVVGTDNEENASFITSSEPVNRLYRNVLWGQRGNFLSVPTDCPQRDERLGWMGDTQVFSRAATYNADVAAFFRKWARDVRDSQQPDGSYPSLVPETWNLGYGRTAWAEAAIIVPWNVYLMYGDRELLSEHYPSMERFMRWLATQQFDGYLYNGGNTQYGDWLSYEHTDARYISVSYYACAARLMEKISRALNLPEKEAEYRTLYSHIKTEFQTRYIRPDGKLNVTSQTAYLLALQNDLFPDSLRAQEAAALLVEKIRDNGNRLSTGFVGTAILNQTLSRYGATNVAYDLLLQRNDPSWLYSVDQGATTIWERWNSYTRANGFGDPGMNSFNHYAYGAVAEWMYRYMAGIEADENAPGFKHFILQPAIDTRPVPDSERITMVDAEFGSCYGKIKSKWERLPNGTYRFSFTVPANTTATLYLPQTDRLPTGKALELEAGNYVFE